MLETFLSPCQPTTSGRRGFVRLKTIGLHKGKPIKKLVLKLSKNTGRNNKGRITVRHKGGGHKRKYRLIDWKRNKDNISAVVERIEYDPNRGPYIALLLYKDGERRYIICPKDLKIGETVLSGNVVPIKIGNCLPIFNIPVGSVVHCVELKQNKGAQLARGAGCFAQVLGFDNTYAILRLKSGEIRKIFYLCRATIGSVCNSLHNLIKLGKAGRSRWSNIRPRVRGVAMNPVDHPLGGGEGKTSGGRHPCSPTGLVDGKKTRKKRKLSTRFILKKL